MRKYVIKLKLKDYLTLIVFMLVGFGWLLIDQIFLPDMSQRFLSFFILLFVLYYMQFLLNKPLPVFYYANSITLISLSVIIIFSITIHVFIRNDFSMKSVFIWLIVASMPYLAGFVYMKMRKNLDGE